MIPLPTRVLFTLALAALTLGACADSPTTPIRPSATGLPAADIGMVAISCLNECSWTQGQPAIPMGSTNSRVCFLTQVGGKFQGSSEWVGVVANLGRWYLTGSSQQSGVRATAHCVSASYYSSEVTATSTGQGDYKTLPGKVCGLTRVGGALDSDFDLIHADSGKLVAIAALGGYVTGSARCVSGSLDRVGAEQWWQSPASPTEMTSTFFTVCALSGIGGEFDAADDWMGITRGTSKWRLAGTHHYGSVAWSNCVM